MLESAKPMAPTRMTDRQKNCVILLDRSNYTPHDRRIFYNKVSTTTKTGNLERILKKYFGVK
jgi:hypothetical protein